MKGYLILTSMVITCLLYSCGKSSVPTPVTNNGNTGGNTGGSTGGNTGGTTPETGETNHNGYITKTVGISRIRIAVDKNNKLVVAEFVGGGNHIVLRAGTGNTMAFSNPTKLQPAIEQQADTFPDATYPPLGQAIDNGGMLDTSGVVIKLKGFDKTKSGYNQLNLVLCDEVYLNRPFETYHNVAFIDMEDIDNSKDVNGDYFANAFTGTIKVSGVELAPPVSSKSYIVRDIVASTLQVNYNNNKMNNLQGYNQWGTSLFKMFNTSNDAIYVGKNLKTELVNSDKGTLGYTKYYDAIHNANYYWPTFSNILKDGRTSVSEPADSTSKVFFRITGFDPVVCGFNQLRVYIAQDGFNPDDATLSYIFQKQDEKPTVEFLKQSLKTSGLVCDRLAAY